MEFNDLPVVWQHRFWGTGDMNPDYNNGVFLYGDKATIFASDKKVVIMPVGNSQPPEVLDIPSEGMQERHMASFLNAVRHKDHRLLSCTVEDAFMSTATVQLAMMAYYTGSEVQWDMENKKVIDNKQAAKLMARPYRKDYKRPKV